MSMLTSVVVVSRDGEDQAMTAVNGWLAAHDRYGQQLARVGTDGAGGDKAPCMSIWAAEFNYLDTAGFTDAFRAAPWRLPECAMAWLDGESCGVLAVSPARPDDWKLGESWMESYVQRT